EAPLEIRRVVDERCVAPLPSAARRLDQDHVGAEVGEEPPAEGGVLARQLDDPQPIERSGPVGRLRNSGTRAVDPGLGSLAHVTRSRRRWRRAARAPLAARRDTRLATLAHMTPSLRRSSISDSVSPTTSPYT